MAMMLLYTRRSLQERTQLGCVVSSAVLEVVARDKTGSAAVAADDLGLPPAVVLQAQDGEDVAFAEGEFFGDGGLVHVHCAGWEGGLVGGLCWW